MVDVCDGYLAAEGKRNVGGGAVVHSGLVLGCGKQSASVVGDVCALFSPYCTGSKQVKRSGFPDYLLYCQNVRFRNAISANLPHIEICRRKN